MNAKSILVTALLATIGLEALAVDVASATLSVTLDEQAKGAVARLVSTHGQELGADKQAAIDAITKEYEAKLAAAVQPAAGESDDKQVFKAYFAAAYDTFNRMLAFAKASPNKEFFREKINKLITTLETSTGTM